MFKKAILLGIPLSVLVCLVVSFAELVVSRGGSMEGVLLGGSHLPAGAIAFLLLLLALNAIWKKLRNKIILSSKELLIIYVMLIVAALLSSFGLGEQLIPNLAGVNYFATPENKWRELFFSHIPRWLVPWDPNGPEKQKVVRDFYEGLHYGEPIPWGAWLIPLISWSIFALLLFSAMFFMAKLVRKQWIEVERLTFPLLQLPLEMCREETSRSFFKNKLMWIGFSLPFIYHSINGLHKFMPYIPELPVIYNLNQHFQTRPWSDLFVIYLVVSFSVVAIGFLLPSDISFSFWFFFLFFRTQELFASMFGATLDNMPVYPARFFVGYQSTGACVVVAIYMIYLMKRQLKEAIRNSPQYVIGLLVSILLAIIWMWLAGMNLLVAGAVIVSFLIFIVLVLSRCVSEVGLLMIQGLFRPIDIIALTIPRASLGAGNLAIMSLIDGAFMRDVRGILLPTFMDGFKISDVTQTEERNFHIAFLVGIPIVVATVLPLQLWIIYRHGGVTLNNWFLLSNPQLYFQQSASILSAGSHTYDIRAPIFFIIGGFFAFFLYIMRTRYWWWPFHPLGYAMGATWPVIVYWFPLLIGWFIKVFVNKYGGLKLFVQARPFFLGMILGEFATALLWASICSLVGVSAPYIPLC